MTLILSELFTTDLDWICQIVLAQKKGEGGTYGSAVHMDVIQTHGDAEVCGPLLETC